MDAATSYAPAGRCPQCHYAVDPGVCSECGRHNRPSDIRPDNSRTRLSHWENSPLWHRIFVLPVATLDIGAALIRPTRFLPRCKGRNGAFLIVVLCAAAGCSLICDVRDVVSPNILVRRLCFEGFAIAPILLGAVTVQIAACLALVRDARKRDVFVRALAYAVAVFPLFHFPWVLWNTWNPLGLSLNYAPSPPRYFDNWSSPPPAYFDLAGYATQAYLLVELLLLLGVIPWIAYREVRGPEDTAGR